MPKLTKFPGDEKAWLGRAGKHSAEEVPQKHDEKLVFAVLEAIDWQCWNYEDAPSDVSEKKARAWLVRNAKTIRDMHIPPPSYLGVMAGKFQFLVEE